MFRRSTATLFRQTPVANMKVIVGVKRVVDYTVKVRVKDNKVDINNVKMSVNPFDEIAIEEAIRMKEKKIATEVIAVTIGNKKSDEVLRTALALGADKAIHVVVPEDKATSIEPLAVAKVFAVTLCQPASHAKVFAKLHEELKPDVWMLGKQAVDGDFGVTPQLLAGLIDAPQGTFASAVEVSDNKLKVTREIDAGRQVVELTTPCVLAADLRLNTPRFPNLKNIMKARKMKVESRKIEDLGVSIEKRLTDVAINEPEARKAGVKVKDVEELVDKLKNEAKAL